MMPMSKRSEHELVVLTRFLDRLKGFLVQRSEGCVLLISPCSSIHTFGMGWDLDVAFFDREGVVIRSEVAVPPRRIIRCRRACGVLERRASQDRRWYCEGERVTLYV